LLLLVAIHSIYIHGGRALETPNHTWQWADYFFINEQIEESSIQKKPVVTMRHRQSQTPQSLNPSVVPYRP
jgi:hypothetical protein